MKMPLPANDHLWKRGVMAALDLLYPPSCALCECPLDQGRALCAPCAASLPRLEPPFCGTCGEPFAGRIDDSFECPNCTGLSLAFEFARPAMPRENRILDLIHRLKYSRQLHLAADLATLASEALDDPRFSQALAEGWPLVPVPLHRRRLQNRHFNQSWEIARALALHRGLPLLGALQRVRPTDTQTRLGRKQRMQNLRGAFVISGRGQAWLESGPAAAILVDDVLTTGSTVHECAAVLRKAGFMRVQVLTVMRG